MTRTAEAFLVTPGYQNCPKCGGWQVLDKTKRRANGWPIGPIVMENCDNCAGKGEVKLAAGQVAPKPVVASPWGGPATVVETKVQHEPTLEANDIEWGPAAKADKPIDKPIANTGWGTPAPKPNPNPGWG